MTDPEFQSPCLGPAHRLGFTGTKKGWTVPQANAVKARLSALRDAGILWMHNGDCVGSDHSAASVWAELGGKLHLHPPNRDAMRAFLQADAYEAPKSYLARNADIAARSDLLIATPDGMSEQLRSGTWSTVRRARRLEKTILIIWPDGSETVDAIAAEEA